MHTLLAAGAALAAAVVLCGAGVSAQPSQPSNPTWYSACLDSATPRVDSRGGSSLLPGSFSGGEPSVPRLTLVPGIADAGAGAGAGLDCPAYGYYVDTISENGWGYLHIETKNDPNVGVSAIVQSYAAGWLEAQLMPQAIFDAKLNTIDSLWPNTNQTIPSSVEKFLTQQAEYLTDKLAQPTDEYWQQANLFYIQLRGMYDGYQMNSGDIGPLSELELLVMNANGEASDMQLAMNATLRAQQDVLKMHDLRRVKVALDRQSHCSALIRILPDGSDLVSAHTTWTSYSQMLRTMKSYKMANAHGTMTELQFSSFPGGISSVDDWYQTSNGLVVIETTNNVANMTLYELVTPQSVPTFVRVMIANVLAETGQTWSSLFARQNGGTYNNQWMITDNKQFTPGETPRAGTLWIASQAPGQVVQQDVTDVLIKQGYWASYNIPYFPSLWKTLGYAELVQQYGADGAYLWDYEGSFRQLIFAREMPSVVDIDGVKRIIQYNKWQTDPLSRGSSGLAIAAREDLTDTRFGSLAADGAIDAKLSSVRMMGTNDAAKSAMSMWAKCGPTIDDQKPFTWSTSPFSSLLHRGQPDTFDFEWVKFVAIGLPSTTGLSDGECIDGCTMAYKDCLLVQCPRECGGSTNQTCLDGCYTVCVNEENDCYAQCGGIPPDATVDARQLIESAAAGADTEDEVECLLACDDQTDGCAQKANSDPAACAAQTAACQQACAILLPSQAALRGAAIATE